MSDVPVGLEDVPEEPEVPLEDEPEEPGVTELPGVVVLLPEPVPESMPEPDVPEPEVPEPEVPEGDVDGAVKLPDPDS